MTSPLLHQFFAAIAPWAGLSLLFLGRNPFPGLRRRIAAPLLAALVLFAIPLNGWNAAAWVRVLEPNPSLTLTGVLLVALFTRLTGHALFRREDWRGAVLFEAASALVLYPMGLGLTRIDPYAWGWDRALPLVTGFIALILILRGNRFGVVLLLPFAGRLLGLQESTNFWDALIDPFCGTASLLAAAAMGFSLRKPAAKGPDPDQGVA